MKKDTWPESVLSIILRSEDKAGGYSVSRGLEAS